LVKDLVTQLTSKLKPKRSRAKAKAKSKGTNAVLPAKPKEGPYMMQLFERLKVPLSLPEALELKPHMYHSFAVLMADIARHKGYPITTVEGVPTTQFSNEALDAACA
jgi:hypothetical protein